MFLLAQVVVFISFLGVFIFIMLNDPGFIERREAKKARRSWKVEKLEREAEKRSRKEKLKREIERLEREAEKVG